MALVNSPQGLPYPDKDELLNDIHNDIKTLALVLDKKVVGVFANNTELNAQAPHPAGRLVWMRNSNTLQIYDGAAWKSVMPATPRIYSGTAAPAANLGAVGDLYIQF